MHTCYQSLRVKDPLLAHGFENVDTDQTGTPILITTTHLCHCAVVIVIALLKPKHGVLCLLVCDPSPSEIEHDIMIFSL